jgi:integrase
VGPNSLALLLTPRYSLDRRQRIGLRQGFFCFYDSERNLKTFRTRLADSTKILTRQEITAVLGDLRRKAKRSPNTRHNLIVFRLACCCGLRASEIATLQLADVRIELARPHLKIRRGASKGGYSRTVPLWWDAGTLADLRDQKAARLMQGAHANEPFVGSLRPDRIGTRLSRHTLRKRFRTACKILGKSRLESLTIHHGRHTFISHALAGGRTLAEVRDAAGHWNVTMTSAYLHVAVESDDKVGVLFQFE